MSNEFAIYAVLTFMHLQNFIKRKKAIYQEKL